MPKRTHGLSKTKAYYCWSDMIKRCHRPNNKTFCRYGAKGITVCPEWLSFETFLKDMGHPLVGMTIDRIDGQKGYSKQNCRWATPKEQSRNIKRNTWIEFGGRKMILQDWADFIGVHYSTISKRIANGLPTELVLSAKHQGVQS